MDNLQWKYDMAGIKSAREQGYRRKIVARDISVSTGAKQYAYLLPPMYNLFLKQVHEKRDKNLYEVIDEKSPVRLYFDCDSFDRDEGGYGLDLDCKTSLKLFHDLLKNFILFLNPNSTANMKAHITRCIRQDKPNKHSFHAIYPGIVFKNINELKMFVLSFAYHLFEDKNDMRLAFKKQGKNKTLGRAFFDLAVYTKDRCFRLPFQSKKGDSAKLIPLREITLEEIENNICQPEDFVRKPDNVDTSIGDLLSAAVMEKYTGVKLSTYVRAYQEGVIKEKIKTKCIEKRNGSKKIKITTPRLEIEWDQMKIPGVETVEIREDKDFLQYFDPVELRGGFYSLYIHLLKDICYFLPDEVLKQWMGHTNDKKANYLIKSNRKKGAEYAMTGGYALELLAKIYGRCNVRDLRDPIPKPTNSFRNTTRINVTPDRWRPIEVSDMKKFFIDSQVRDLKTNTYNDCGMITAMADVDYGEKIALSKKLKMDTKKKCQFITGQMGASKSTGVMDYMVFSMISSMIANAMVIVPRCSLAGQTVKKIYNTYKEMISDKDRMKKIKNKRKIVINPYFSQAYTIGGLQEIYDELTSEITTTDTCGTICVCVLNSISKVRSHVFDTIIMDEPVTCVDNFYIDSEKKQKIPVKNILEKKGNTIAVTDLMIDMLMKITRNANQLIFIDAAFTEDVIRLCETLYWGAYTMQGTVDDWRKVLENEGVDQSNIRHKIKRIKDENILIRKWIQNKKEWNYDKKTDTRTIISTTEIDHFRLFRPIEYICVYDKKITRPIYTHIIKYDCKQTMMNKLLDDVREGKKLVVYCSVGKETASIINTINSMTSRECIVLPKVGGVTAKSLKGKENQLDEYMRSMEVVVVSSVLGTGTSYPEEGLFDAAYMFCKVTYGTPQISDMIQLSARVRATTTRTLHYHITTSTSGHKPNGDALKNSDYHGISFKDHLDKTYTSRDHLHRVHMSRPSLASEFMINELQQSFGHVIDETLEKKLPTHETNSEIEKEKHSDGKRKESKMAQEIDKHHPDVYTDVMATSNRNMTDEDGTKYQTIVRHCVVRTNNTTEPDRTMDVEWDSSQGTSGEIFHRPVTVDRSRITEQLVATPGPSTSRKRKLSDDDEYEKYDSGIEDIETDVDEEEEVQNKL
ncbi:ORF48 [Chlamys acute necrobiotic virus]|nr:ORF48 [Chlamys acute necrobiotic virus]